MASLNSKFCFIQSRSWISSLLLLGFVGLTGCGRSLDPKVTEKALKDELAKQGVGSLKDVSCPSGMAPGQNLTVPEFLSRALDFVFRSNKKVRVTSWCGKSPVLKGC